MDAVVRMKIADQRPIQNDPSISRLVCTAHKTSLCAQMKTQFIKSVDATSQLMETGKTSRKKKMITVYIMEESLYRADADRFTLIHESTELTEIKT